MNSELLKAISESLTKLKKEKRILSRDIKALKDSENFLSFKGKAKLDELVDKLQEVEDEIEAVQIDYSDYEALVQDTKKLKELIGVERKPETKKTLQSLYEEKMRVLKETELEFSNYYTHPKKEFNKEEKNTQDMITDEKSKEQQDGLENKKKNNNSGQRNHKLKKIVLACGGIYIMFSIIGLVKGCGNTKNNLPSSNPTAIYEQYQKPDHEVEPIFISTTENVLEVNDIDGIYERAINVFDDMDYLGEINHSFDGKEIPTIVNIIRVSNGELPLDANGNEYYNPNVVDKYIQARTDMFANCPSSPQLDKIYGVDYADIVTDDPALVDFAEKYDAIYNSIAEARNSNNNENFVHSVQKLGELMYNDWVLRGMYDGNNPYNFEPDQRLLALGISTERYASYVMEYENSTRQSVCADVCIDYSTGTTKEIPVQDIFDAIVLGISNDAALAVNTPDGYQVISESFYKNLVDELKYKNELLLKMN